MKIKTNPLIFLISAISLLTINSVKGDEPYRYENAQALREYCQNKFQLSDVWYAVVRYNGYTDIGEIKKGAIIQIPTSSIKYFLKTDPKIQKKLSDVIKKGAEVFAKDDMNFVKTNVFNSDKYFKTGAIKKAETLNRQIIEKLDKIESVCDKAANQKVEAKVYDLKGDVDKQPAGHFSWIHLTKDENLREQDKVRTMMNSFADIIFKDESHIFLDENSMILIKKMRENRLKRESTAVTVLVNGDLQALVNAGSPKNFNVDIPEIETSIKSKSFWLRRNRQKDVSISNYDGTIKIASAGKSVTIKKNEGLKVKYKRPPSNPIKLLPSPGKLTCEEEYTLTWNKVKNAVNYQIQVASNQFFQTNIFINKKVRGNRLIVSGLKDGVYYWRVRSINKEGLPGDYSPAAQFVYRSELSKPFLYVRKQVNGDSIRIEIETQIGNTIAINNGRIIKAKKHSTFFDLPLKNGNNLITIEVKSPQGISSQKKFSVQRLQPENFSFNYPKQSQSEITEITSVFKRDYIVKLNNKEYRTKNKKFKKIIKLNKGINLFPLLVKEINTNSVVYSDTIKIILK